MAKTLRALFALLLVTAPAAAQVSFVTVTGSNTNYPNGTITANFKTPPNTAQSSYSGQRFTITQTVPVNASGAWHLQVADNTSLFPAGSQWQLNLCSQGTFMVAPTCFLVTMPVTCISNSSCSGSTLDVTSAFAAAPIPPAPSGSATLPNQRQVIAGNGLGGGVAMPEKGVTVNGAQGLAAWSDDFNGGVYDPRDPQWAGGIYGPTPAAAAQAMSNQMACDLATVVNGVNVTPKVRHAYAKWPQGNFPMDQLVIAPGSTWEGTANATGGTLWFSITANHQTALAAATVTLTCPDGQSHTDNLGGTHIEHITMNGCSTGGCAQPPGDPAQYLAGGPGNTGLELSSTAGVVEYVTANNFGGYGIRIDGQDTKEFHTTLQNDISWYYDGGYKGVQEGPASTEVGGVTTTGTTSSIALAWPAVSGAAGYVVYRGTAPGAESVFYLTTTNSLTDTGATATAGLVYNVITAPSLTAPTGITATPSTTGGTLAAATYYYIITPYLADAWHAALEFQGADNMADWAEVFGRFDSATPLNYHHMADILIGGGFGHFDHLWPQLGHVGIAVPFGGGGGAMIENFRSDFARLEGIFADDINTAVRDGLVGGACTQPNALALNTGQENTFLAGTCNQLFVGGGGSRVTGVHFEAFAGFGPSVATADYAVLGGGYSHDMTGVPQYQGSLGVLVGFVWEPTNASGNVTGPTPSVFQLSVVNPTDTSPVSINQFNHVAPGQVFYVPGGNTNVTILNNPPFITTCSGASITLGTVKGRLQFVNSNNNNFQSVQVCGQ